MINNEITFKLYIICYYISYIYNKIISYKLWYEYSYRLFPLHPYLESLKLLLEYVEQMAPGIYKSNLHHLIKYEK